MEMTASKRIIQYVILLLGGFGAIAALTAFYGKDTMLNAPSRSTFSSSESLANACVVPNTDDEQILFISCGGIY